MKTIHYINHTHWDREWYRSSEAFRVRLVPTIDLLLKTLEDNPSIKSYTLDGQFCILEDYLKVKPFNFTRILNLVQNNRLLIGPWYIQPDLFLVSSESIIRNLQIGIKECKTNFGKYMNLGWIPDAFGQISQTPQIFKKFGFNTCYSWRGFDLNKIQKSYFNWISPSGDSILNIHFGLGYGFFRYLSNDKLQARIEILNNVDKFIDRVNSDHILFTGGSDHSCIQPEISNIISSVKEGFKQMDDNYDIKISDPLNFASDLEEALKGSDIPSYFGEAKDASNGRIHAGISSTRMDLKILNKKFESLIVNILEPLNVIMQNYNLPSLKDIIVYSWKQLLKNQFHDSIYSSSPEYVNKVVENRYLSLKQGVNEIIFEALRFTRDIFDQNEEILNGVIINTLPYKKNELVKLRVIRDFEKFSIYYKDKELKYQIIENNSLDYESEDFDGLLELNSKYRSEKGELFYDIVEVFVEEIPPMSLNVIEIRKTEPNFCVVKNNFNHLNREFRNEFFQLLVNDDGTITLKDNHSGAVYSNLHTFIDCGDSGDEYNFSYVKEDKVVTSKLESFEIVSTSEYMTKFKLELSLLVPESSNFEKRSSNVKPVKISSDFTIYEDSPYIDITTEISNYCSNHLLKLCFSNFDKEGEHLAGDDFGFITRNNFFEVPDWSDKKLVEMPLPIYSFKNAIICKNNSGSYLNFITNTFNEYQFGENGIEFSALRCVGMLGKENLATRPGRASGYCLETPSSQMFGKIVHNYSFSISNRINRNDVLKAHLTKFNKCISMVHRLNNDHKEEWFWENKYYSEYVNKYNGIMPLIDLDNSNLIMGTVNESLFNDTVELRLYNPNKECIKNTSFKCFFSKYRFTNLVGVSNSEFIDVIDNKIYIDTINSNEFITIEVRND